MMDEQHIAIGASLLIILLLAIRGIWRDVSWARTKRRIRRINQEAIAAYDRHARELHDRDQLYEDVAELWGPRDARRETWKH